MLKRIELINSVIPKGCFLFGAGANGIWCLDYFARNNINVIGFIDSDPNLIGRSVSGIKVYSYQEYTESFPEYAVFITVRKEANKIFTEHSQSDPYIINFYTWFEYQKRNEYKELIFDDEKSYNVLNALIDVMRGSPNTRLYPVVEKDQYFCLPWFTSPGDDVFVDAGAYFGDTIERFVFETSGAFNKIYAFEPGDEQRNTALIRINRLKAEWHLSDDSITLVDSCIGERDGYVSFIDSSVLSGSRVSEDGNANKKIVSLDSYLNEERVSFIKTDVEGSDFGVIQGAQKIIKKWRPKLAVSVYHKPDDLLRTYKFINEMNLGYKFLLRQHSTNFTETVLYC